jgi:hypothetical protein
MPTRANSANAAHTAFKSNYAIPKVLWYRDGGIIFRNGEWCSLRPSAITKTWADCCRECGRELEIGENCSCKPAQVIMLRDDVAMVLSQSQYSLPYLLALLEYFCVGRKPSEIVAVHPYVKLGSLKQFCNRVQKKLDALDGASPA